MFRNGERTAEFDTEGTETGDSCMKIKNRYNVCREGCKAFTMAYKEDYAKKMVKKRFYISFI